MRHPFAYIMFILLFLFHLSTFAQNDKASLHGKISDAQSNDPLIGAFITIPGTSIGVATDYNGNYSIPSIDAGDYELAISYIGYDNKTISVSIESGEKKKLNIQLDFSGVQLGAVEVTAQAKGQMSAINEQLNSNQISNIVSAERIQELPDANAAETIGRLPGVSVQRVGGEGNKVVVRGLSPKYNKVMIEGMSMASSGGDRSTDISMISPYSLDGIEVMKAVTADKDADFIGGAVNFKLRSADSGLKFNLVTQGSFNALKSTANDYMFVASASNRFFKDKLGLYVQGNIEKRNRSSNVLAASYDVKEENESRQIFTEFLQLSDDFRTVKRQGATVVLDYKLNNGTIHFKNFYSNGNTNVVRYREKYNTKGLNTRDHSFELRNEQYKVSSLSNIINYEQTFGVFTLFAKVSNSVSKRDVPSNYGFVFNQQNALDSKALTELPPPYELHKFASLNDTITYLSTIDEKISLTNEDQQSVNLDLKYDFSINKKINGHIKVGGKYRQQNRNFNQTVFTGNFELNSGQGVKDKILTTFPEMQNITQLGSSRLPFALFSKNDFDHGNFLQGDYVLGHVADVDLMNDVLDVIKKSSTAAFETYGNDDYQSTRNDYKGIEILNAGYTLAELNFGPKIKFIPGIRYEKNKTTYTAPKGDFTATPFPKLDYQHIDTTVVRENSYFFPSFHLKYSPVKWFHVRAAYTETLSRPSYYQFVPREDILTEAVIQNNSKLIPEYSKNLDLSFVFHENKVGLFTISGFSKNIENMIFGLNRRVILDPSIYNLPKSTENRVIFTQANNTKTATVRGVEFDWQTSFWYLPGALKGLILNLNYTRIFSKAFYPKTIIHKTLNTETFTYTFENEDSFVEGKLLNQPDHVVNVQLGYDYKDFSIRIATLYQSKIFSETKEKAELNTFIDAYNRWDISLKYKLPWYDIQLFSNINNLTSASDRKLIQGAPWPTSIQYYGTTIDLGLRVQL